MPDIVLVEDNEMNRDMLARRLVRRGFFVRIAADGGTGIRMVEEALPDLVLMDMTLPDIDGLEVTRKLKANARTRDVPILVLTARAMAEDRERAFAAGADDYDVKPVDIDRLLGKMRALLERKAS
ncbi:response regulator [Polyangium jinanense]|uniref:Response regulator n=1 Tax=Polyangium jinanense TaxID=2829994 RepID=A0A9X3X839_9BACT|nr:response regulator [Polyangium jinanense]MDC3955842.1 response regulator [Polyangium jinanense]MDC3983201.1 response regulator [Polyangium jinanense]